jgi:hypothetical protein
MGRGASFGMEDLILLLDVSSLNRWEIVGDEVNEISPN